MQAGDFLQVPVNLRIPGQFVEFNNAGALRGTPPKPNRILVFGQMLAAGSAPANTPILISGGQSNWTTLFGRGSQLTTILNKLRAANSFDECWAIAQADNGAGTAATGSIKFTALPAVAGTQNFYIAGQLVQIAVAPTGMTLAQIATALAAAINADLDLPVTAQVDGVDTTKVDLTCIHKGVDVGNIDIRTTYFANDANVQGLGMTIVQLSGGAGNPLIATAIANLGNTWFVHWVMPYTDGTNLTALQTELDRRLGPLVQQEGHSYITSTGSVGTLATFGQTFNTNEHSCMGVNKSPTPPYLWTAVLAGVCAASLGIDPARQVAQLQLPGILAPAMADRFIDSDKNNLLFDGISTFDVDDGGNVTINNLITMYRNNPAGLPDPSYLEIETMFALFYMRFSLRVFVANQWPRYKLADDGTVIRPGAPVTTPSKVRAGIVALAARDWDGFVMDDLDAFKAAINVVRDNDDPDRVNALLPPNIIGNLRRFAGQIAFTL
ncbi:MAG TPA: phage tail sheath subtilisin-like domain-containing protein [Stellaceae bacterium]|jgi:phage tail sheath gpL-like